MSTMDTLGPAQSVLIIKGVFIEKDTLGLLPSVRVMQVFLFEVS